LKRLLLRSYPKKRGYDRFHQTLFKIKHYSDG
jgi:hypothetical protein